MTDPPKSNRKEKRDYDRALYKLPFAVSWSSNHYAFLASDEEFDGVLQRVKDEAIPFGSGSNRSRTDGEINYNHRGRTRVLLRMRERSCLGGYHPHVHHRLAFVDVARQTAFY